MKEDAMHDEQVDSPAAARSALMARVRAALGRDPEAAGPAPAPAEPPPGVADFVRLARAEDDLLAMFEQRAVAVGMKVQRIKAEDLVRAVVAVLESVKAVRVLVGAGSLPQALGLKDALRRKGVEVVDWASSSGFEIQYDTDAGITDVHAALAETGTLVCCSDSGHSRGLSLVPPVHVAIVRKSDILPDMIDFWVRWKGKAGHEMPSSVSFITGPSKTADIEGVLITGVHGPGQVFVLLAEDV